MADEATMAVVRWGGNHSLDLQVSSLDLPRQGDAMRSLRTVCVVLATSGWLSTAAAAETCDSSHADECVRMGRREEDHKRFKNAIDLFAKGCEWKNTEACNSAAAYYDRAESWPQAFAYYVKACDLHDATCCGVVGTRYREGKGTAKDPNQAKAFWEKACRMGNAQSCEALPEVAQYCTIDGSSKSAAADLKSYLERYQANKQCRQIRVSAGILSLPEGLRITALPPPGKYGVTIGACTKRDREKVPAAPACPPGDVVLDFSGYTPDGGDCPVRIRKGAKADFVNLKIKVKNRLRAVCTEDGAPILLEDNDSEFSCLHNVDIDGTR
jgi:hypothetical protein